jgi:hypothetical protein
LSTDIGQACHYPCSTIFRRPQFTCTWTPVTTVWPSWILQIDDSFASGSMMKSEPYFLRRAARGFDINTRELFCAALVAVLWGHGWAPPQPNHVTHVRAWSDNASAVSWIKKLCADNPFAQELIRAIGFSEATHRFRLSASHLPGSINRIADAGSRSHDPSLSALWTKFVASWLQTPVPKATRQLFKTFSISRTPSNFEMSHSVRRTGNMQDSRQVLTP